MFLSRLGNWLPGHPRRVVGLLPVLACWLGLAHSSALGAVLLQGTQLKMFINNNGSMLDSATTPTIGVVYLGNDFITPGAPVEQFTIAANGVNRTNSAAGAGIPVTVVNTSTAAVQAVTVIGTVVGTPASGLQLSRRLAFNTNDSHVHVTIRLTNNSAATFTGVAFLENADPDESGPPANFITNNSVLFSGKYVRATIPSSTTTMAFASADLRAVVSVEPSLSVTNPFKVLTMPNQPAAVAADNSINLAFNFGTVVPGQSVVAEFCILFAPTPGEADAIFAGESPFGNCGLVNVSSQIRSQTSQTLYRPLRYVSNSTGTVMRGNIAVLNSGIKNIDSDVSIVLPQLPPGVALANANGKTASGHYYLTLPGSTLPRQQVVRFPVTFINTGRLPISTFHLRYPIQAWAGAFDPSVPP